MTPTPSLSDLPPSAKYVRYALKRDGPLTWTELKGRTGLAESTLTDALDALEAAGIAAHQPRSNGPDEWACIVPDGR